MKDLSLDPGQRGMLRDIDMDNPSCPQLHDHEYVDHGEEGSVLCEEVACKDLAAVVLDKGTPCLAITRASSFHHVLSDRARRMLDAELEAEFFKYLVLAPSRIVYAHAADEVDVLARNLGPSDLLGSRLPAPIEFEALAVPSDDCLRFDEDEGRLPAVPESGEPQPEGSIGGSEPGTFLYSHVDGSYPTA